MRLPDPAITGRSHVRLPNWSANICREVQGASIRVPPLHHQDQHQEDFAGKRLVRGRDPSARQFDKRRGARLPLRLPGRPACCFKCESVCDEQIFNAVIRCYKKY